MAEILDEATKRMHAFFHDTFDVWDKDSLLCASMLHEHWDPIETINLFRALQRMTCSLARSTSQRNCS